MKATFEIQSWDEKPFAEWDDGKVTKASITKRYSGDIEGDAVLEYLLACAGRVVSAEELLERVWDEAADPFTTAVKQTMRRLRAKLGDPPVIATVREGGYQIGEP